jgi:cell division protein FtsZ
MTINLKMPDITELKPRITVFGVGGAGGNAVNNMIQAGLQGCDFVCANTDAQALSLAKAERIIQMGIAVTEGLGAGSQPEVGRAAAEEVIDEINDHLAGSHMVFITAGMGGGTGTGAAPVIARAAREMGILTVGVVTKPFQFEGQRRMRIAEAGIEDLQKSVDTLIVIPNQNLFRVANEKTTFADAFAMADQVLYSGVACITDLMVKEGLINLDFADVRSIMRGMGKAMMGTGEASGDKRASQAAEAAISNPLLDETSMKGARGLLISITGGKDLTLFELDEAATRIREEVDPDANIILGATFDDGLEGIIRVSVVATGIDKEMREDVTPTEARLAELTNRLRTVTGGKAATPAVAAAARVATVESRAAAALEADLAPVALAAVEPMMSDYHHAPALLDAAIDAHGDEVHYEDDEPEVEPYVPPVAERPAGVSPRMPRLEDFPAHTQGAIRGSDREEAHEEDKRPMSLLRRIASGLSRHSDHDDEPPVRAPVAPPAAPRRAPVAEAAPVEPVRRAAPRAPQADPYQRPRAPEQEPQRQAPRGHHDDDQLEIPAFLRRQAN